MHILISFSLSLLVLLFAGCQQDPPPQAQQTETAQQEQAATPVAEEPVEQPPPPRPPLFEDFQGEPQLTLFPRAGDFRPADDSENLPYWATFIEHLVQVSGLAEEKTTGNRAWRFRSINTIDSVAYFSPVAVDPKTAYKVSFTLLGTLPEGATAGAGILEFDEFLWIGEQYTEEIVQKHFRGSHEGVRLPGTIEGEQSFTFTTSPETGMVHLILFREGPHDRSSVMFDDIRIEEIESVKP
ncbi:MAG: hypothetical protein C0614_11790 [Desulfuromonas sp.]|nr:MAG: hypothetical protein C0614_11790 [Desulfuromonas sp.]